MAASVNDYFLKVGVAGTLTQLAAPGHSVSGTTITVNSTTNWPTDTGLVFAIRQVDGDGEFISGTYTEWRGIVSGSTLTGMVLVYGTDQVYPAGSTTQVYIPVSASRDNRMVDGLLVSHDNDGTLKAGAVDNSAVLADGVVTASKLASGAVIGSDGYYVAGDTWVYVSASSFKITGVDRRDLFPVGTKIKLTQTTDKYFYVTSTSFSTDTTVNITAGTDYTLANATITNPKYSYAATPQGFPHIFSYDGGASGSIKFNKGSTGLEAYTFSMDGKRVKVKGYILPNGTGIDFGAGGAGITIPLPVTV